MKNEIKLGIILMILATLCFGIMDGVSRYLAEEYNVFIINMYRSWVFGSICFNLFNKKRWHKTGLIFEKTINTNY